MTQLKNQTKINAGEMSKKAGSYEGKKAENAFNKGKASSTNDDGKAPILGKHPVGDKAANPVIVAGKDDSEKARKITKAGVGSSTNDCPVAKKKLKNVNEVRVGADKMSTKQNDFDEETTAKANAAAGKDKKKADKKLAENTKAKYDAIFSTDEIIKMSETMMKDSDDHQQGVYLFQLAQGKSIDECFDDFESLMDVYNLDEKLVKAVDSKGKITRKKDRKTRARQATQTTGLSKSKRRQIARKATKTKKTNVSGQRLALRKRMKAMKKRKSLGIK